jgi:hypothetical protein
LIQNAWDAHPQQQVQGILTCYGTNWGQPFTKNIEEDSWRLFSSCITILEFILQLILRKPSWNLKFWTIQHSLEFAPLDFNLFGLLKSSICRQWWEEGSGVWLALHSTHTVFLSYQKVSYHQTKCTETWGIYMEKRYISLNFHAKFKCGGKGSVETFWILYRFPLI